MSKIAVLLADLEPDAIGKNSPKWLPREFWDDILAANARGVSPKKIYSKLTGQVSPFPYGEKSFGMALALERARRKKAAQGAQAAHKTAPGKSK